ncbi:MAG: Uma2 family endonuclease [Cytophagales bacterium]|nr:Uma2 family endonuclease [Cytophagales bacterium]
MNNTLVEDTIYTYNDLTFLPDGNYEIINGKHIDMSPAGFLHGNFESIFSDLLRKHFGKKGYVAVGEIGIVISKAPFTLRAADVVYISKETYPRKPVGMLEIPPDLVIEIIYESRKGIEEKVNDYLSIGVKRIIVTDIPNSTVTIYQHGNNTPEYYTFEDEFELFDGVKIIMNKII